MKLQERIQSRAGSLIMHRRQLEFQYDLFGQSPVMRPELPSGSAFQFPCEPGTLTHWNFEGGRREREQIERYLRMGDQLAVIRYENEVACRGLVRTNGFLVLEGHRQARSLRDGEAFIHYCRTASAFTGRSLYPQMLRGMLWSLAGQDGITEVTITCRDDNVASTKGIERAGFRLKRELRTIGLLGGRIAHTWQTEVSSHHE